MLIIYLISFFIYGLLIYLVKHTKVYKCEKNSSRHSKESEPLKFPIWIWILSILSMFIPVANIVVAFALLFLYSMVYSLEKRGGYDSDEWVIEKSGLLKWLCKKV